MESITIYLHQDNYLKLKKMVENTDTNGLKITREVKEGEFCDVTLEYLRLDALIIQFLIRMQNV